MVDFTDIKTWGDDVETTMRECDNGEYEGLEFTFEMKKEGGCGVDLQDLIETIKHNQRCAIGELCAWGDGTVTVFIVDKSEANYNHMGGLAFL